MPRARSDILKRPAYHRKAISLLGEMYDKGEPPAALGLAVSVYLVVHDPSKRDLSLLTQLGLRPKLRFIASGPAASPANLVRQTTLVFSRVTMTAAGPPVGTYEPFLGDGPYEYRLVQFPTWWENDLIYLDGAAKMNRRKLVFTLRSQEGGTHYDGEAPNPYFEKMSTVGTTTPLVLSGRQPPQPILGTEFAMMRQIAWELGTTLERVDPIA